MKKAIISISCCIALVITAESQVTTNPTVINPGTKTSGSDKIIVNKVVTSNIPTLQLTQGKDLTIKINKVDDVSSIDMNIYKVQYTVTNCGTENLLLNFPISIKASFSKDQGKFFYPAESAQLLTTSSGLLYSGETIQGVFTATGPHLNTGNEYKLMLMIDGEKRLTEADENNNTAETSITARAIKNADFYLESAKVTIFTGNDNKEANNSKIYLYLGTANNVESVFSSIGDWTKGTGYAPEMKVNSSTDFYLKNSTYYLGSNTLCKMKQKGVALTIIYDNKAWATDAWKINSISVTLYFKDRNGNAFPHPSFASKTINFNVSDFLGYRFGDDITTNKNQIRILTVGTDQNFNPLPPLFGKLTANGTRFTTLSLPASPTYNTPLKACY